MQAVGRIQFQPFFTAIIIGFDFVDISRAEPGAGTAVLGITRADTEVGVMHNDMRRLIHLMKEILGTPDMTIGA